MSGIEVIITIVLSAISVILGWYGREFLDQRIRHRRRLKLLKKQGAIRERAADWILDYYIKSGQGEYLFTLPNGKKIPYLSRPEWQASDQLGIMMQYSIVNENSNVAVNKSIIRNRELIGQRLWDGPVLCLHGISKEKNRFNLVLHNCSYLQYATIASRLEDEIYHSLKRKREKTNLRDKMARSIVQLETGMLNAQILGFTTAIVTEINGQEHVLIQSRSNETGIAQGMFAVIPSFVCNPQRYDDNCLPLDRHFFLMELLEELYNLKAVERDDSHIAPNWFYAESPVNKLQPLFEQVSKENRFRILGFGFDLFTGELNVAACAVIRESDLSKAEYQRMRYNYEVNGVQSVPINGNRLKQLIVSKDMYVTSAFTLSCLLRCVIQDGSVTKRHS